MVEKSLDINSFASSTKLSWVWCIDQKNWEGGNLDLSVGINSQRARLYALYRALQSIPRHVRLNIPVYDENRTLIRLFGSDGRGGMAGQLAKNNWKSPRPVPGIKMIRAVYESIHGRDVRFVDLSKRTKTTSDDMKILKMLQAKDVGSEWGPAWSGPADEPRPVARRAPRAVEAPIRQKRRRQAKEFTISFFDDGDDKPIVKGAPRNEYVLCEACGRAINMQTGECLGCSMK